jgi:predicted PurR-regulated permease PerM
MATGSGSSPHDSGDVTDAEITPRLALSTLVAGLVVLAVLIAALVLWTARSIVLLLFLSYTLAVAIEPGVDKLSRRGVPRALAIVAHLALLAAFTGLLLWLFVPVALDQTEQALQDASQDRDPDGTLDSIREQALVALEDRLAGISSPGDALSAAVETLSVFAGIAFTVAAAVYWLVERDRLVGLVLALVEPSKRRTVRDTWLLIDLKLGAVIRTKLLLVLLTGTLLSIGFWIIGLPYFLLVGAFAGIVEVLPVIGPLIAGLTAVAAGLSVSWKVALAAALVVYGLRIFQDYVMNPHFFGHAVQLPPLVVLIAVSAIALLLGPLWVPLAIPLTAVFSTLLDVLVWKDDPAKKPVPTVLVRTKDTVAGWRSRSRGVPGPAPSERDHA